jgi:uncharacterized protein
MIFGETAASRGRLASNPDSPIEGHPMATFELFKDRQGQFRWRLKASNGKIIADSGEGYVQKSDCQHGIDLVKSEAAGAGIVDASAVDGKAAAKATPKIKAKAKTAAKATPKVKAKAKVKA